MILMDQQSTSKSFLFRKTRSQTDTKISYKFQALVVEKLSNQNATFMLKLEFSYEHKSTKKSRVDISVYHYCLGTFPSITA